MTISYKKLWKLLIDKEMSKKDLIRESRISSATVAKMVRGETVTTDTLLKICVALGCDTSDIMEISEESPKENQTECL